MTAKLEIQWTPMPNKFITWASEICLYEIQPYNDSLQTIRLSNTTGAQLIATNSNYNYIKCLDIYPKSESDLLVAVGQTSGKVTLSSFGNSEFDTQSLPGKEFVPRQTRPCNAVSWNPIETNLLAVGLDKHRSDNCVLLWDIMKYPLNMNGSILSGRFPVNTMAPAVELAKPVAELGVGEVAHSLSWFNGCSKLMAVGMNMKCIKLIDFRDPNKVINSTMTKAVYGVAMNPHDDRHLASFVDNQIHIWDRRNFEKAVLVIPHIKQLLKIEWCPTKYNLLGSLVKDNSLINLYDIQHTVVGDDEVEPSVLERVVEPGSPHNITSFCWHKSDENRFLTIALSGSITDYTVFDRITLNWAPSSNIVWTYGRKTMKCIKDEALNDISTKMKTRARQEYGLKQEFYKNSEMVDSEMLSNVWHWLTLSNNLVEDGTVRGHGKHPGVQSVLKLDPTGQSNKSEAVNIAWADVGNVNCHGSAKIYKHEDRDRALLLCSWPVDRDSISLTRFVEHLEQEGAHTRAAAVAVFSLRIRLAIEVLGRAPGDGNGVVAMALAGFCDEKSSMWRDYCRTARGKLCDPYLRAMFGFLTAESGNYDSVLNENGIAVDDKVAFACIFLPDNKLQEYLRKLIDKLIDEGNLDGLLLTGNTADGIRLLQRYLDGTSDIQTTALLAVRAFPNEVLVETVKDWITSYRNLLDTWQLWNERANFDIVLAQYRPSEKPPQQVYSSCFYCGKSISTYLQALNRGRGSFPRMSGVATTCHMKSTMKSSSCPNCRKPLPRCSICLMHMGSAFTGIYNTTDSNRLMEFSIWFTWCQTCRHGGHSAHMIDWFEEHSECPVMGCNCRCYSIDAVANSMLL